MKKIISSITIILIILVCSSHGGQPRQPWEKENVSFPMMNSEIRNALKENETQKELREEQVINSGVETVNKTQWEKYKETYTKAQDRLRIISFALQAIPTGYQMSLYAKQIKENQMALYEELKDAPYTLVVALPAQYQFVDDLQMTTRLLAGIVVSYGAINQMERAERQKMLNYALDEVRNILYQSSDILFMVRNLKKTLNMKKYKLKFWKERDKAIVKEIITNVNFFTKL